MFLRFFESDCVYEVIFLKIQTNSHKLQREFEDALGVFIEIYSLGGVFQICNMVLESMGCVKNVCVRQPLSFCKLTTFKSAYDQ